MDRLPRLTLQCSEIQRLSPQEQAELARLAATIQHNSLTVERLTDRVYQLMQMDLQHQHERICSYGRRF